MTTDGDVAIIGAGIAGLTAARRLAGAGREPVVFEREDRVGGRIKTIRRDGFTFDVAVGGHNVALGRGSGSITSR